MNMNQQQIKFTSNVKWGEGKKRCSANLELENQIKIQKEELEIAKADREEFERAAADAEATAAAALQKEAERQSIQEKDTRQQLSVFQREFEALPEEHQ